METNMKTMTIH